MLKGRLGGGIGKTLTDCQIGVFFQLKNDAKVFVT